jgi:hypothetical protein
MGFSEQAVFWFRTEAEISLIGFAAEEDICSSLVTMGSNYAKPAPL